MRIAVSWRGVRLALSVLVIVTLAWIDPQARPWIVGIGVFTGLAMIVAKTLRRRAAWRASRTEHRYGSFEATLSTLTFTREGKSRSIRWDEVESVAYSEDPITREPEWWLRSHGPADRLKSIPDIPADRSRLLGCFAVHLPGFDPDVFEREVLSALREDPEAVVECWNRRSHEPNGTTTCGG